MSAAALKLVAPEAARVLIVEDSAVARAVIAQAVDGSNRYLVVGAVASVAAALAFLAKNTVEFILLDINLPGVDGITALPDLLTAGGAARILIVSSAAADGAAQTVQALALGAADTLAKPAASSLASRFGAALIDKLDRLGEPAAACMPSPPPAAQMLAGPCDVVAIGASTGGIHALSRLLRELPSGFRTPVLVCQHLPATFMPYFAAQLALIAGRPCEVASDHLRIRPGRLIVAPGDAHLTVARLSDGGACVRLSRVPSVTGCMPSVDVMLAGIAAVYGARATAAVLSGMGRDGAEGARTLAEAGGTVLVQDEASSVIWGMPGAVAAQGIALAALTPEAIGRSLAGPRRA
ncbi:chemotaxis protein CheB [Sphingomonas sp.]|uniref:chemotaxis protein CheB n=1 Tax=Sphingomonas sp. TaxID=28214 RepID=UPI003CC53719